MSLQILASRVVNKSNLKQLGLLEENAEIKFIPLQIKDDLKILLNEEPERKAIVMRRYDLLKALFKQRIFEKQNVFQLILQKRFEPHIDKINSEMILNCIEKEHLFEQINTIGIADSTLNLALKVEEIVFAKALLERKEIKQSISQQNFVDHSTALIKAVEINNLEIVEKILDLVKPKNKIDFLTLKNSLQISAIDIVINKELKDIFKIFLRTIDINSKSKINDTILHVVTNYNDLNFIQMILDQVGIFEIDAFVQAFNDRGQSALHIAARRGYFDVLRTILKRLSDRGKASSVMLKEKSGVKRTPGIIAIEDHRENIINEVPFFYRNEVLDCKDELGVSMRDYI